MATKVLVSDRGEYLYLDEEIISYIVIVYNKYGPEFVEYDCDENKKVLCHFTWDEETWEDCIEALQLTYSISPNWHEVYIEDTSDHMEWVPTAIKRMSNDL